MEGFLNVCFHATPIEVAIGQTNFRITIALVGGFAVPRHCDAQVLLDPGPFGIGDSHERLRRSVPIARLGQNGGINPPALRRRDGLSRTHGGR